jgi:putative SOS response-associated peptidase YedK
LVPTENIAARLAIQQAQRIVLPRYNAAPDQSISVVNRTSSYHIVAMQRRKNLL